MDNLLWPLLDLTRKYILTLMVIADFSVGIFFSKNTYQKLPNFIFTMRLIHGQPLMGHFLMVTANFFILQPCTYGAYSMN
jgi:hypothetical protein